MLVAQLTKEHRADSEKARDLLDPILAEGKAPELVHMVLGSISAQQGDLPLAKMHLEQTCRLNPRGAVALNNLAWVVSRQDEPDLGRLRRGSISRSSWDRRAPGSFIS